MKLDTLKFSELVKKSVNKTTAVLGVSLASLFAIPNKSEAQVVVANGTRIQFGYNNTALTQSSILSNGVPADTLPSWVSAKTYIKPWLYVQDPLPSEQLWALIKPDVFSTWKNVLDMVNYNWYFLAVCNDTSSYVRIFVQSTNGQKIRIKNINFADWFTPFGNDNAKVVISNPSAPNRNNFPYYYTYSTNWTFDRAINVWVTNNSLYNTYQTRREVRIMPSGCMTWNPVPTQTPDGRPHRNIDKLSIVIEREVLCSPVAINSSNQSTYKWKTNVAQSFTITPWTWFVEIKWTINPKTIFQPGCPNSNN